ncbi:MAG TPA: FKBP-type peptidyl-prolyl cis-trans isomerase [Nitrospirota bacterium]|nr:FKBP-type peptidyl-prolyl cis-trans isomerase [Nitrospirota bacterium]
MKFMLGMVLCAVLLTTTVVAAENQELKTQKDKVSYVVGLQMGNSLKNNTIDVNLDILVRGIKDAISGAKPLMAEQEMRETIMALQKDLQAKQQEKVKALSEKNKKEGEAFLAENKKKQGVITMPSGLQYKILTDGKGKSPKATDTVTVNYKGTLIDGTEFDSSYNRGEAATLPVGGGMIKGWTEALQLMKEGSKWQLFIPSNLAYGERGVAGAIGPNAVLIFEVELISIKKQ